MVLAPVWFSSWQEISPGNILTEETQHTSWRSATSGCRWPRYAGAAPGRFACVVVQHMAVAKLINRGTRHATILSQDLWQLAFGTLQQAVNVGGVGFL